MTKEIDTFPHCLVILPCEEEVDAVSYRSCAYKSYKEALYRCGVTVTVEIVDILHCRSTNL